MFKFVVLPCFNHLFRSNSSHVQTNARVSYRGGPGISPLEICKLVCCLVEFDIMCINITTKDIIVTGYAKTNHMLKFFIIFLGISHYLYRIYNRCKFEIHILFFN